MLVLFPGQLVGLKRVLGFLLAWPGRLLFPRGIDLYRTKYMIYGMMGNKIHYNGRTKKTISERETKTPT